MDIDILREFVSLYETCSFQDTAENLSLSQSALTKHIQKLETELNVSLFDRSTRTVRRNEYGKAFYPYARQMVQLEEKSRHALEEVNARKNNIVRVAFTPACSHYGLIDTLSYFVRRHPDVDLKFNETRQIDVSMEEGRCDFVFATDTETLDERYNRVIYQTDHLAIVFPADHPLAGRKSVTLEDIRNEPFVMHINARGQFHQECRLMADLFKKADLPMNVAARASFSSTMLKMVEHQGCVAIIPRFRMPENSYGISAVDFEPRIRFCMYMIYPKEHRPEGAASVFLEFMMENAEPDD